MARWDASTLEEKFSNEELEVYPQHFEAAGADGSGLVSGPKAAAFLQQSGISRGVLHQIWEMADADGSGRLDQVEFFIALRLVAHVQAGKPLMPKLGHVQPTALPDVSGLKEHARSDRSGGSAGGFMRPGSGTATPPTPPSEARATTWSLTSRDKHKYASLFLRIADGSHVSGEVARDLMQRSDLPMRSLAVVWEHADRDGDGRLTFREFVVMTHLITRTKKNPACILPDLNEALPNEVELVFSGPFETPEELAATRSPPRTLSPSPHTLSPKSLPRSPPRTLSPKSLPRSPPRSRESSPIPAPATPFESGLGFGSLEQAAWSSLPPTPTPDPRATAKSAEQTGWSSLPPEPPIEAPNFPTEFKTEFKTNFGTTPANFESGFGEGFADFGDGFGNFAEDQQTGGKKKKEEKKKKEDRQAEKKKKKEEDASSTDATGLKDDFGFGASTSAGLGGTIIPDSDALPKVKEEEDDILPRLHKTARAVADQTEAVIKSDKEVARCLQDEVVLLEESAGHLRRLIGEEESQVQSLKRQRDREVAKRDEAKRQLQNAKRKVEDLQVEGHACSLESISMQRDLDHLHGDILFMRKTLADEERSLESLKKTNIFLEKSCKELELQHSQLLRQQREVAEDLIAEKEILRQEMRNNAELRDHLERTKRDFAVLASERYEAGLRQQLMLEMEGRNGGSSRLALQDHPVSPGIQKGVASAQRSPLRDGSQRDLQRKNPGTPGDDRQSSARAREQSPPLEAIRHTSTRAAAPSWVAGSSEWVPKSRPDSRSLRTSPPSSVESLTTPESGRGRWSKEAHSWAGSLGTDPQKTQAWGGSVPAGPRSPVPTSVFTREGV